MAYNPPLQVVGFVGTRLSDPERGPLVLLNSDEARQRQPVLERLPPQREQECGLVEWLGRRAVPSSLHSWPLAQVRPIFGGTSKTWIS